MVNNLYSIDFYGKGHKPKCMTATADKYPNGYFKDKKCLLCNKVFKPLAPSHHYCSSKCMELGKADSYYFRNYGISIFQYYELYTKSNGTCYICGSKGFTINKNNPTTQLVVDHNHLTGKVRGLLCPNCNRALGLFKDNKTLLSKAIDYIESDLDLTNDEKNRIYRNRKKTIETKLTKEIVFAVYTDLFINNLISSDIVNKYGITKETVNNLKRGKYRRIWLDEWNNINKV